MPKPPVLGPLLPFPEDLVDEVYKKAAKKALYYSAFTVGAAAAAPYFPKSANLFLELTVGLGVTAERVIKIKPLIVLNLLPEPIGVTNPELFDLPADLGHFDRMSGVVSKKGGSLDYIGSIYASLSAGEQKRARQVAEQLKTKTYTDLVFERDQFNDSILSGDLGTLIRQAYADEIALRQRKAAIQAKFNSGSNALTDAEAEQLTAAQFNQFLQDRERFLQAVAQLRRDHQSVLDQMRKDTGKELAVGPDGAPKKTGGAVGFLTPPQYTDAALEVIAEIIAMSELNRLNPADP